MDCKTERRFAKKDLSELCEYLGIPEKLHRCIEQFVVGWRARAFC